MYFLYSLFLLFLPSCAGIGDLGAQLIVHHMQILHLTPLNIQESLLMLLHVREGTIQFVGL